MTLKIRKKILKFHVLSAGCSLLRAECFFCNLARSFNRVLLTFLQYPVIQIMHFSCYLEASWCIIYKQMAAFL